MEYLSVQEYSKIWNISKRRIQILCKEGRIPNARMIGNMWVIPENTSRPIDARIKSPIIETSDGDSTVRKELKKLLKGLFDSCNMNNIEKESQKDYVLSILAAELCAFYLGVKINNRLLSTIYTEISTCKERIKFYSQDLLDVEHFIVKFNTEPELNNILSWAYQYSNKFLHDNLFYKTQFFTERYMIRYLVNNTGGLIYASKILDPCVGGGNFLAECLEFLCHQQVNISTDSIIECCSKLYGYDIDSKIARIAVINIKLRVLAVLRQNKIEFGIDVWKRIKPNIYISYDVDITQGSLAKTSKVLFNITHKSSINSSELFSKADVVLTNPPFASIKGMSQEQKQFLKKEYPLSNCDTCVAFLEAIGNMLSDNGVCGIVTQNAWMHLKSFALIRNWIVENYKIERIVILGSGAFQDLNGEKSNVALVVFSKRLNSDKNKIKILNVSASNYEDKAKSINKQANYVEKKQRDINVANGFDFTEKNILTEMKGELEPYSNTATPMQGTSTGNAKELVGYFWEHFGDPDWICVSKGGGYCRWQGLNNSVVKWGREGEYIKQQVGSALRNTKYFHDTQIVFSDTGTAGLNVRILLENQIFIASGPGIRIKVGNKFAHMALLNSRIASYFVKTMSPKLTIAAGYISRIPIKKDILFSVVLKRNAESCIKFKRRMLSTRTTNIEYSDEYLLKLPRNIEMAAWRLFNDDITSELMKLKLEYKIDRCIIESYGLPQDAIIALDNNVGICAYEISGTEEMDLSKLDKYINKLLDSNCCLKRTKNTKAALGSDGYIEYTAKDLNISPEIIVRRIQANPYKFKSVLERYKYLLLHNYVLFYMRYNTVTGVARHRRTITDLLCDFNNHFEYPEFDCWIKKYFNNIHTEIFKGKPILVYSKGEIHLR